MAIAKPKTKTVITILSPTSQNDGSAIRISERNKNTRLSLPSVISQLLFLPIARSGSSLAIVQQMNKVISLSTLKPVQYLPKVGRYYLCNETVVRRVGLPTLPVQLYHV
jgi:hypothetical protein